MIDHVVLNVKDVGASRGFYEKALAPIGYQVLMAFPEGVGFGKEAKPYFWIALREPQIIIGRSHPRHTFVPDVDLWALGVEQARTVSRRHCRISSQGESFFLEDLGSMNGTRLNDQPVEPGRTYRLGGGDRLSVGNVQMVFHLSPSG